MSIVIIMNSDLETQGQIVHYEQQFQDQPILPPTFFVEMIALQRSFAEKPQKSVMSSLLCYYTDCVNYFAEKEEPVCEYFQYKIKDLIRQMKPQEGKSLPKQSDKKRDELTRNVMKEMQQKNIHSHITQELRRQETMDEKVKNILIDQNEKLEWRRKTKRSMSKSQSVTFSFGSINSSPDLGMREQPKKYHGMNAKFLFKRDISSSEDEEQTTT